MKLFIRTTSLRGQTALEYLLLLAVVAAVVFIGFKSFVPAVRENSEAYFNKVGNVIKGVDPTPQPGHWCPAYCPDPNSCGPGMISRTCACPAPAFGGAYCDDGKSPFLTCPRNPNCAQPECTDGLRHNCLTQHPYVCGPPLNGHNLCNEPCREPASSGQERHCIDTCQGVNPHGEICPGTEGLPIADGQTWRVVSTVTQCQGAGSCTKYCNDMATEPNSTIPGAATDCGPFFCKGPVPANATPCNMNGTPLTLGRPEGAEIPGDPNVQRSLISNCTGNDGDCEYACSVGYHYVAGISNPCTPNVCASSTVNHPCPNATIDVPLNNQAWRPTRDCAGAPKCSYLDCDNPTGTSCLAYECKEKDIPNSSFCANSEAGLTADRSTSPIDSCINAQPGSCKAACISGFTPSGNSCVPVPVIRCGDGTCTSGSENCTSCPADCGACQCDARFVCEVLNSEEIYNGGSHQDNDSLQIYESSGSFRYCRKNHPCSWRDATTCPNTTNKCEGTWGTYDRTGHTTYFKCTNGQWGTYVWDQNTGDGPLLSAIRLRCNAAHY